MYVWVFWLPRWHRINGVNETTAVIEFNGEFKHNNSQIAQSFNRLYVDSIQELTSSIQNISDDTMNPISIQRECKFNIVDVDKIDRYLRNISSKGDCEFITKKILFYRFATGHWSYICRCD